jgi:hypothetical protein
MGKVFNSGGALHAVEIIQTNGRIMTAAPRIRIA